MAGSTGIYGVVFSSQWLVKSRSEKSRISVDNSEQIRDNRFIRQGEGLPQAGQVFEKSVPAQPGLQVTRLRLRVRGAKNKNRSLAKNVPGKNAEHLKLSLHQSLTVGPPSGLSTKQDIKHP
jgi:hypothetical protein